MNDSDSWNAMTAPEGPATAPGDDDPASYLGPVAAGLPLVAPVGPGFMETPAPTRQPNVMSVDQMPLAPPAAYHPLAPSPPPVAAPFANGAAVPSAPGAGEMPHESAHMLGLSVIALGLGALVGTRYGGIVGGISGGFVAGGLVNGFRAVKYWMEGTDEAMSEAKVSAAYFLGSTTIGGVIWNQLVKEGVAKNPFEASEDDDEDEDEDDDGDDDELHDELDDGDDEFADNVGGDGCPILPVGP